MRRALLAILLIWSLPTSGVEVRQPLIAGGLEIFYGVMPAEVLLAHPPDHAERTMHGGVPGVGDTYHLVVSLFDSKKRVRITDAQVQARVSETGQPLQTKPLQPMTMAGVIAYGGYFSMTSPGPVHITLDIVRSSGRPPIQVSFEHHRR